MPARFAAADLVIAGRRLDRRRACRRRTSGAADPVAGAMDDHQTANARQLESAGGGLCLAEAGLDAADLAA